MFEVGQAVFSATHGKGVVWAVVDEVVLYPVQVMFHSGAVEDYTSDGKLFVLAEQPDLALRP
jgi:hypothetical protein